MAKSKSRSKKRKQALRKHVRRQTTKPAAARLAKTSLSSSKPKPKKVKPAKLPTSSDQLSLPQKRTAKLKLLYHSIRSHGAFKHARITAAVFISLVVFMTIGMIFEIRNLDLAIATNSNPVLTSHLTHSFDTLKNLKLETANLKADEDKYSISVADNNELWAKIDAIAIELTTGNVQAAYKNMKSYTEQIKDLKKKLATEIKQKEQEKIMLAKSTATPAPTPSGTPVPIIIYHYTPADFDAQLSALAAKGYTTISMDNLSDHLRFGRPLPAKPVIITFDDGFKNQLNAFEILKRHQMKATFYIITSGEASHWCIGAGRRYDQTPGCGDAYLDWDDVIQLDHSGSIEIAAHTVNHLNLPSQSPAVQEFEIRQSKSELEAKLGHPIHHFAYPYGSYNATSVNLVKAAGFSTAVTTQPGSYHDLNSILTLSRVRDVHKLP